MPLADLMTEEPTPARAQITATCGQCVHFSQSPYYSMNGAPTVCSLPAIGRQKNSVPCPNFAPAADQYLRLAPRARQLLDQLLTHGDFLPANAGNQAECRRRGAALEQLSTVLRTMASALRAGLVFGEQYNLDLGGEQRVGRLLSVGRAHAVLEVDGVPCTVSLSKLGGVA